MRKHTNTILITLLLVFAGGVFADSAQAQSVTDRLEAYIQQTGEMLRHAADLVSDAPNPRSVRILEQARLDHQRSIKLAQSDQPKMAFAHSERARQGARQAGRIARELSGDTERLQRRLERYMELRERVGERVHESGDERALRFLRESESQARRARELQKQGDIALALQVLEGAEDLLGRAARIAFEEGGKDRFERELERTRVFVERISNEHGNDPHAADLLTSAKMALRRAEEAAAQGHLVRALKSLQLARRLASRAAAPDERLDEAAIERQIERFDQRMERVSTRVRDSGSDRAGQVLQRALQHRERAASLLDQAKLEPALRQIKAGLDLLAAADDLAG